jgi:hypothetical protein
MIMRQSVTAGKTPVGTEVQAKLVVGTLGNGTVFPKKIFSGKVIESVARPRPNRPGLPTKWILFAHYGARHIFQLPAWGIC